MAKELFNQTTASILDRAKRFAFGGPSQEACDNILISTAVDEIRGQLKLGVIDSTYVAGTLLADCAIIGVNIKLVSGTPTFKIGTTSGGEELIPLTESITESVRLFTSAQVYAGTIYPRVIGAGTINVTLILERNLF